MAHAVVEFLAEQPDATCVLLVHTDVRLIRQHAQAVAAALRAPLLSVGKELSALLINEPSQVQPRLARSWLSGTAARLAPGPVLLVDIDLLFEPAWALDPLALFKSASRSARLIVAWPGIHVQDTLAYAVPEHTAYRIWHHPGIAIIDLI